jgi:hypothetical protein
MYPRKMHATLLPLAPFAKGWLGILKGLQAQQC